MSAVIDRKSFDKNVAAIERARADDTVQIVAGGTYDDSEGFFIRPTVLLGSDPSREYFHTEYFGLVLAVHVYEDDDYHATMRHMESIAPYALTGSILACDREVIAEATETLRFAAGNFYINDKPTGAVVGQQPFGGGRLRHQRQGRRDAEPHALELDAHDQGDVRPADALRVPVPGVVRSFAVVAPRRRSSPGQGISPPVSQATPTRFSCRMARSIWWAMTPRSCRRSTAPRP